MTRYSLCLAEAGNAEWRLVFKPDELHLYVAPYRSSRIATPMPYMTIEDFLVRIPQDDVQKRAHGNLVRFLIESIQTGAGDLR